MIRTSLVSAILVLTISPVAAQSPAAMEAVVDQVFAKWTTSTPGCAVGVAVGGKPVLVKAYGMADLEHDVPNTPETIFESGSVAKQFTALAVMLLVGDGKLSLDDPVRKHIPELPDYGVPLTIRHMLTHTSGLRDWGSVASIAGAPRTTREYTHGHVLDIVSRQKSLNFTPGSHYSYSNTGYNLSAIIVARVSGMPFAEFSRQRIFAPLGLTHTSWRDDHTRIVKGRAIAYSVDAGNYTIEMPFENVHGNGGLLTTVGDLLKWNENFVDAKVGDVALLTAMQTPRDFPGGGSNQYALGLMVVNYRSLNLVHHSGSTAGYRAHLNRFPERHTSVAVLCNVSSGDATGSAHAVSDVFLSPPLAPRAVTMPAPRPPPPLDPQPSAAQLAGLVGGYWSEEAETMLIAGIDQGALVLRRRPDTVIRLTAIGPDKFRGSIGTVTFLRTGNGAIEGLSVNQERVWDLRFVRK